MSSTSSADQRLLAAHVLRRIGFGPSAEDMERVLQIGPEAYVAEQLDPASIDDSAAEKRFLPRAPRKETFDWQTRVFRWLSRMQYSRRQLLERMTLFWHEHFATSHDKVRYAFYMELQERLFRKHALGRFPTFLAEITRDQAMLIWLDNDGNDGRAVADGRPIPPNENYARELLQVFSMGPTRLAMDGTPVLDASGAPVPNYTEQDVREIARALTGWRTGQTYVEQRVGVFDRFHHDPNDKTILGETVRGRRGARGAEEVEDVVAIIMRHPSTAPFVATQMVLRLVTETPTPGYVERVATVFRDTDGDLTATVRAVFTDPELSSEAAVRSQPKTPIELVVGAARALDVVLPADDDDFLPLMRKVGHLPYKPPSVFSFYRPGGKSALVDTATVGGRDQVAHELVREREGGFDPAALLRSEGLATPEQIVDALTDRLVAAPIGLETRAALVEYMAGRTSDAAVRGVAWLVLCSSDFHRN